MIDPGELIDAIIASREKILKDTEVCITNAQKQQNET